MRRGILTHLVVLTVGIVIGIISPGFSSPDRHVWMLVAVMITGGMLGGLVNYFLTKSENVADVSLLKSVCVGIGAALLVPLFLNMLSSDLLQSTATNPLQVLVFLGFCLIASITSKAFITSIADRLMKEVKDAKADAAEAKKEINEVRPVVDALAAKETEMPAPKKSPGSDGFESVATPGTSDAETKVLEALADRKYTFRFLPGIVSDTELAPNEVDEILARLRSQGLVGRTADKTGVRFFLTTKGREMLGSV